MEKEKIVCSAIWYNDGKKTYTNQPRNISEGIVVAGLRHCNCFSTLVCIFPDREYIGKRPTQGFLTTNHRFVDRYEGMRIARAAGQVTIDKPKLNSEMLY